MMRRNALLTAYNKDNLVDFAQRLALKNWIIYASSGTAKVLKEHEIPVTDIATIVGEPMLGHKVVTLSREILAGLLADPSSEIEVEEMDNKNLPLFDLVYVNLYPLYSVIENDGEPYQVIALTDIGGPTILRAAAKGFRYILTEPEQLNPFSSWLENGEKKSSIMRLYMRSMAELIVANYARESHRYWNKQLPNMFECLL